MPVRHPAAGGHVTAYEDMDAAELAAEERDWTLRTLQCADDLASAIDGLDIVRAALMVHAYRQSRAQLKRIHWVRESGIVA